MACILGFFPHYLNDGGHFEFLVRFRMWYLKINTVFELCILKLVILEVLKMFLQTLRMFPISIIIILNC